MANGENKREVIVALDKLNGSIEDLKKTEKYIRSQIDIIPINFGRKDELGLNTETYLTEIANNMLTTMISPMETTYAHKGAFEKFAEEMDAKEDFEAEQLEKEKQKKEKKPKDNIVQEQEDNKEVNENINQLSGKSNILNKPFKKLKDIDFNSEA